MNGSVEPTTRGVAIIVLSGALLGLGYNYLGQLSRPARGLAWISEPRQLPSLEDLYPATAGSNTKPAPSTPASEEGEPRAPEVSPSDTNVEPTAREVPSKTGLPPSTTVTRPAAERAPSTVIVTTQNPASAVADPDDPLGIAVPSDNAEGLPEIPDLDRPFAVQITLVKRFFDAKAAYIVDARDEEEFEEGHIPGAFNLPFSTAGSDPARLEAIDAGERPIIIYCGGGTCEVSMSLAETLIYQFAKRKVLVYMGGFPEWQSAGYPVQKGKGDEVKG